MKTNKGTASRLVLTALVLFILGGLVVLVVKDHLTRAEREMEKQSQERQRVGEYNRERREEPRREPQSVPPSATPQWGEERAEELPSESKERQPIAGVAVESARDSTPAPANLRKGSGIIEYKDGTTQEFFGFHPCHNITGWSVPYQNTTRVVPLTIVKTITVGPRANPKSNYFEVDIETTTGFTFTYAEHRTLLDTCVFVELDDEITRTRKDQEVNLFVIGRIQIVR
jgi:hypothetical protein